MEKRIAKIIVGKSGGTAGKNSKTYKVSLPSKWVSELNLTDEQIELCYDGEKIVVAPKLSLERFLNQKKNTGHKLLLLNFYDKDVLCTKICVDFTDKTLSVENHTKNIVKTAFGNNQLPTWENFENFLEERCIPRTRSGLREYLETIGVEEYNPLEIIKKTKGKMAEDYQWIELEEIV